MARGFGSTFGTNSNDIIVGGRSFTWNSSLSTSCWVWINGTGGGGGGGFGRVWGDQSQNNILFMNGNATSMRFAASFSTTNGQWSFSVSAGGWHHILSVYDGTSTSNTPTIYVDGSSVSVSVLTTPAGTFNGTNSAVYIGNRSDNARNFDGKIAELCFWNGQLLTAREAKTLALGTSPFFVRPSAMTVYYPLFGMAANEPDWGPNRGTQTVTGTAKQSHAPTTFWMPTTPINPAPKLYTGALALTQGAQSAALAAREKFSARLAPAANSNSVAITATEMLANTVGNVAVSDTAASGLLSVTDAALYRVRITETI